MMALAFFRHYFPLLESEQYTAVPVYAIFPVQEQPLHIHPMQTMLRLIHPPPFFNIAEIQVMAAGFHCLHKGYNKSYPGILWDLDIASRYTL